jgi:hypothetical protein
MFKLCIETKFFLFNIIESNMQIIFYRSTTTPSASFPHRPLT